MNLIDKELISELFKVLPLGTLFIYFIYIAYTDYNYRKIPDKANLALLVVRFLLIPTGFKLSLDSFLGALAMFAVFFYVAYKFNVPIGGDIKAVTVTGLYFGIGLSIIVNMSAIAISVLWYYWKKKEIILQKKHIPYGAMMMASLVIIIPLLFLYIR